MSGFRLDDASDGCPPTEAPPSSYTNPFRFDSAGRLWITSCFRGFKYFGAARHDLGTVIMGASNAPNNNPWTGLGEGSTMQPITAGTYKKVTIVNDTECTLGLLTGLDATGDMTTLCTSFVRLYIESRFNGTHHSDSGWSNPQVAGLTGYVRQFGNISANPHDGGFEDADGPTLTLAPGETGEVSARLYLNHSGTPNGVEAINSAGSAIRVYGYILPEA